MKKIYSSIVVCSSEQQRNAFIKLVRELIQDITNGRTSDELYSIITSNINFDTFDDTQNNIFSFLINMICLINFFENFYISCVQKERNDIIIEALTHLKELLEKINALNTFYIPFITYSHKIDTRYSNISSLESIDLVSFSKKEHNGSFYIIFRPSIFKLCTLVGK